jgi:hypothetical protein
MKIGLFMFYDDAIAQYGDLSYKINKAYCKKHNIDIILTRERQYCDGRPSAWDRLLIIRDNIEKYDYVMWIDADAHFYIDSPDIRNIINCATNFNFIFSNDVFDANINSGFFIVKNTPYSKRFIDKWACDDDLYQNNSNKSVWEQGVLNDMIRQNILDIKNNMISHRYGVLQHFSSFMGENKAYILHHPGNNHDFRVNRISDYLNKNYNLIN